MRPCPFPHGSAQQATWLIRWAICQIHAGTYYPNSPQVKVTDYPILMKSLCHYEAKFPHVYHRLSPSLRVETKKWPPEGTYNLDAIPGWEGGW